MKRILILFLASVVAVVLAVPAVFAAQLNQIQLENASTLDPQAHNVVDDPTATLSTEENAVKFLADVPVVHERDFDGTVEEIEVVARGTGAKAKLLVNGSSYAPAFDVPSSTHESYFIDGEDLAPGDYTFEIKSKGSEPGNRLFVDQLIFHGTSDGTTEPTEPTDPDPEPDPKPEPELEPSSDTWTWGGSNPDVVVAPGDDIDQKINNTSSGDVVRVHAGNYTASEVLDPASGVKLHAEPGTLSPVGGPGMAYDVEPAVKITAAKGLDNLMLASPGLVVRGFELTGVDPSSGKGGGVGSAIAGGGGDERELYEYNEIHSNASVGISNVEGQVLRNEFYNNTNDRDFIGFNGGSVKGSHEFEAGYNYSHDEQGNGIWCDNGCENVPERGEKGAWFHHNVVTNNGGAGIRLEEAPDLQPSLPNPEDIMHTAENNIVGGNSLSRNRADIHVHDAGPSVVRDNSLGPQAIAGAPDAGESGNDIALRFSDSGRNDRPDLRNALARNNDLNGSYLSISDCRIGDVSLSSNTYIAGRC